ncbi:hypothetical protein FACS1894132_08010 [Clostridia bacterium]|nr:hypothetical protein FACS1894132_08010 [Clostridia bacterium]
MIKNFFKKILPKYGFKLRKQQLKLSESLLETIKNRKILLEEAEVGIGKTTAYLVSYILSKRYGMNNKANETIIIAT